MEDMHEYLRCLDVIGLCNHIEADPPDENDDRHKYDLMNDEPKEEELASPKANEDIRIPIELETTETQINHQ